MPQKQMNFLDSRGVATPDRQGKITVVFTPATIVTQKSDGNQTSFFGVLQSQGDIFRCAAGTQADGHITRLPQGLQLSAENIPEVKIIGNGCQYGRIAGQGNGGQGFTVEKKSVDQFCCQMLGLGGAAAVPEEKESLPLLQCLAAGGYQLIQQGFMFLEKRFSQGFDFIQQVGDIF